MTAPPLTFDRRRHLARQISEGFRVAIQSGRLKAHERVPATRSLARTLGVSRQIVVTAYEDLAASGHLRGRIGDGSYVAQTQEQRWAGPGAIADPDGYSVLVWILR